MMAWIQYAEPNRQQRNLPEFVHIEILNNPPTLEVRTIDTCMQVHKARGFNDNSDCGGINWEQTRDGSSIEQQKAIHIKICALPSSTSLRGFDRRRILTFPLRKSLFSK